MNDGAHIYQASFLKIMDVIIKKIVAAVCFVIISGNALAQTTDSLLTDFGNSITKKLVYPNELITRCEPTFAILKMRVDNQGEIVDMKLSDSANPLFVVEWLSKIKNINTGPLKKYIKQYAISNTTVLLPINYTFSTKSCSIMNIDQNSNLRLFLFEGNPVKGVYYMLPPVNLSMKFSVSY